MPNGSDRAVVDGRGGSIDVMVEAGRGNDARAASWRARAWRMRLDGRRRAARNLQRASLALPGGSSIGRLRGRFRLLRWQLEAGLWSDSLETIERLCGQLAARGALGGVVAGWVFLARAVCHFHQGDGVRYRRSLALVLRSERRGRRGPGRGLMATAWAVRAAELRHCRGGGLSSSLAERRARRLEAWLDATLRDAPHRVGRVRDDRFRWTRLRDGLEGPRPWRGEDSVRRDRWVERWIGHAVASPRRVSSWVAPALVRFVEERVPRVADAARHDLAQALLRFASSVREPWARALALEGWADTVLWVLPWVEAASCPASAGRLLARARVELRHAAVLYRQQSWADRAARCDERADRLGRPASRRGVAEAATAPPVVAGHEADFRTAPALDPRRFQTVLESAGFVTQDRRLLGSLAPLWLLGRSPLPVLVLGESGTGKDVLARAVHRWSRLPGEFVPIHCGAIPRDLLESELFGHARGAFTGAAGDKPGLIEAADGGTLFLDEIGEMGPEAQMKMLRVLESGEVRRLGDLKPRRVSLRLVAATHRDLEAEIAAGRFRLDLYHRIRGVVVRLPPLRERRGDIPLLAARFLSEAGGGELLWRSDAMARLVTLPWPGNARELRAAVLQAAHLARVLGAGEITPLMLRLGGDAAGGGAGEFFAEVAALQGGALAAAGARTDPWLDPRRKHPPDPWPEFSADPGPDATAVSRLPSLPEPCQVPFAGSPPGGESGANDGAGMLPVLGPSGLEAYLDGIERRLIVHALESYGWNRTHAARALGGLSRTTLISKMKRLGVEDPAAPGAATA